MAIMDMKELPSFVAALILIGVAIGVGVFILSELTYSVKDARTVTDEQITADNESFVSVAYPRITLLTSVYNVTDATDTVAAANLSHDGLGIKITDNKFHGKTVNVSYSGQTNTTASGALQQTMNATATIPTWLTIIVVVAMAAIVLMLIMGAFGGRKR